MTSEQTPLHDRPKVILACICSDFHEVSGGGFNLIRIYDSITVDRPTGVPPDIPLPLPIQAVTCWTEGVGEHVHQTNPV
jgi:hypothetical protein